MTDKQINWIKKMIKYIDRWASPSNALIDTGLSHVWNVKYNHIKHLLNSGYLADDMSPSGYRTSLLIAFLQDSTDKAKQIQDDCHF